METVQNFKRIMNKSPPESLNMISKRNFVKKPTDRNSIKFLTVKSSMETFIKTSGAILSQNIYRRLSDSSKNPMRNNNENNGSYNQIHVTRNMG